jgi:hypothetical protein
VMTPQPDKKVLTLPPAPARPGNAAPGRDGDNPGRGPGGNGPPGRSGGPGN